LPKRNLTGLILDESGIQKKKGTRALVLHGSFEGIYGNWQIARLVYWHV
jgi:hypothetical protein